MNGVQSISMDKKSLPMFPTVCLQERGRHIESRLLSSHASLIKFCVSPPRSSAECRKEGAKIEFDALRFGSIATSGMFEGRTFWRCARACTCGSIPVEL